MSVELPKAPGTIEFRHLVPTAKRIFAVASGKGGVGKSSIATNLAITLGRLGLTTGLLDADIYGPSIPRMLATQQARLTLTDDKINPLERFGIKTLSIGNLVPATQATIWRGPMVHQALIKLMEGVNWGPLDYFIIDLPPGTGDVQLTILQSVRVDGVIMVSTPQQVAIADVRKCIDLFRKVEVPIRGIIENMAFFDCTHGERYYPFGMEGAKKLAEELKIDFLGSVPLLREIMEGSEEGTPYALDDPKKIFHNIAKKIVGT